MIINKNFILRKIREEYFLVPFRKNNISSDVIFLNYTGGIIFENAEKCINKNVLIKYVSEYFCIENDAEAIKEIKKFIEEAINSELLQELS